MCVRACVCVSVWYGKLSMSKKEMTNRTNSGVACCVVLRAIQPCVNFAMFWLDCVMMKLLLQVMVVMVVVVVLWGDGDGDGDGRR